MITKNKKNTDAELAYSMALKLLGTKQDNQTLWDKCHSDSTTLSLVAGYLCAESRYAPVALYKLHTRLVELID